jgi:hypothetical protein
MREVDHFIDGGYCAAASGARPAPLASAAASGRVILCCDDDEVNQLVLQGLLVSQGYRYLKV